MSRSDEREHEAESEPDQEADEEPELPPAHLLRYSYEDPFATPDAERRQDRRLRGRLVAPVTVFTAGRAEGRAGLTVASVLVVEGEPPHLLGAIDPLSDLHEAIEAAGGRFVVHVLDQADRALSVRFAGSYPGDPFAGLEVGETDHGPRLLGERSVAFCSCEALETVGYLDLVHAVIDGIELAPGSRQPLAYYEGHYRSLAPKSPYS